MVLRLTLFLVVLSMQQSFGQLQKIFHEEFDLDTTMTKVRLDLVGEYSIELWPGNNLLVETKIKLFGANKGILDYFIGKGRYDIEGKLEENTLTLSAKDKIRPPIRSKEGNFHEEAVVKIFIPDLFQESGGGEWIRIKK